MRAEEADEYLLRQIGSDLYGETEAIAARRGEFLGLATEVGARSGPDARRELEELCAGFWEEDDDTLRARLDGFEAGEAPEVAWRIARLRRVCAARSEVEAMASDDAVDPRFLALVRRVLVAPPRVAGRLKQEHAASLAARDECGTAARSARAIRRRFGAVYALDPVWFDELQGAERERRERHLVRILFLVWAGAVLARVLFVLFGGVAA